MSKKKIKQGFFDKNIIPRTIDKVNSHAPYKKRIKMTLAVRRCLSVRPTKTTSAAGIGHFLELFLMHVAVYTADNVWGQESALFGPFSRNDHRFNEYLRFWNLSF